MLKPWDQEPNLVKFEAEGLPCEMLRHEAGHWCGYVGVGQDHPWFGLSCNSMIKPSKEMLERRQLSDISLLDFALYLVSRKDPEEELPISLALHVHGGIGYAEGDDANNDLWWFGFDCGHAGDLVPAVQDILPKNLRGTYRTADFVIAECQNLAKQLVDIKAAFEAEHHHDAHHDAL